MNPENRQKAEEPSDLRPARAGSKEVDQERRRVLQGILSIGGLAALSGLNEACTVEEDMTRKFKNNFDSTVYPRFDETDLAKVNSLDRKKITSEDCRFAIQTAMDSQLNFKMDFDDLCRFEQVGEQFIMISKIDDAESQAKLEGKPGILDVAVVEHSGYDMCYKITTDQGTILLKATATTVYLIDESRDLQLSMIYNPSGSYIKNSPEYRDFQRRVLVGPEDASTNKTTKTFIFEAEEGLLEFQGEQVQTYTGHDTPRSQVYETQTFLRLLEKAQSSAFIESFLLNARLQNDDMARQSGVRELAPSESTFSLTNIESIEQLIEVFRLLPPDPRYYGLLISLCVQYQMIDKSQADEYRDPLTTLRSGCGDCDDFAVINYFWAYLHNYSPNFTVMHGTKSEKYHVLVWYRNEENHLVVLDNDDVQVMASSYTVESYLSEYSPTYNSDYSGEEWVIDYNGPG